MKANIREWLKLAKRERDVLYQDYGDCPDWQEIGKLLNLVEEAVYGITHIDRDRIRALYDDYGRFRAELASFRYKKYVDYVWNCMVAFEPPVKSAEIAQNVHKKLVKKVILLRNLGILDDEQ